MRPFNWVFPLCRGLWLFLCLFFMIAALRSSVLSTSMHSWKLFSLPSSMSEGGKLYFLFREPITLIKYRMQTSTQSLSVSHLDWPRMTSLFLFSPDLSGVYLVVSTWCSHSFFFLGTTGWELDAIWYLFMALLVIFPHIFPLLASPSQYGSSLSSSLIHFISLLTIPIFVAHLLGSYMLFLLASSSTQGR